MKYIILLTTALLTACSSLDHFVCVGTGTCSANAANAAYAGAAAQWVSPTPQTVITNAGTYLIVRNQGSGTIMSINRVSGGK